jgi:hypothetical protein
MKLCYIILLACSVLTSSSAFAMPIMEEVPVEAIIGCEDSVFGTCAHFSYGDGAGPDFEVEDWVVSLPEQYESCDIESNTTGISCTLNSEFCPVPAWPDVQGSDIPGVASCDSCGGQSPFIGTINEAKCCLIVGQPTGPNGEIICDH